MPRAARAKNIANHVAFVLDASTSMDHLTQKVIEVADAQVASLAKNSQDYNQETRISIWVFSDPHNIECVVWDMDVLRLPSIAQFYQPSGNTALIDATLKSIDDLATVSQIYGDHSFLMFVWTDGEENRSLVRDPAVLSTRIKNLPDNWTVAALVPNVQGVAMAKRFGFPAGNIQIWDASTAQGMEEASQTITHAHTNYMAARATGMRSTTGLFDMSSAAVNAATIQAAGLAPLDTNEYILTTVVYGNGFRDGDDWISAYTTNVLGHQYVAGRGYYQLTLAPVKVQVQKDIAIVEKKSGKVYTGKNARALLGLPDMIVTLRAGQNPDYDIFIQSTSPNRKLLHGQRYLYLTPQATYVKGQTAVPPVKVAAPKVAQMPLLPKTVARRAAVAAKAAPVVTASGKVKADLTAPIYPGKSGKAAWAGRSCPTCYAGVNKRCLNGDGSPMEKPHTLRKI
jgi:hypothetical protein